MGQRGRKKGAVGEQSRTLLLNIAADEFAQQGYYETKVSRIVSRAGLTQPAFYLYFNSKEAILQELVELFRAKLFDLIQKSRLQPGTDVKSIRQRITVGLTTIFSFLQEEPSLTRIGFMVAPEAEEIKKQLVTLIKENLISEQKDGFFHAHLDMGIVADSIVGIIERLTFTKLLNGLKNPESLANEIVRLLLYGMLVDQKSAELT